VGLCFTSEERTALLSVVVNLAKRGRATGLGRDPPRARRFPGGKTDLFQRDREMDTADVRGYDPGPTLVPPVGVRKCPAVLRPGGWVGECVPATFGPGQVSRQNEPYVIFLPSRRTSPYKYFGIGTRYSFPVQHRV